MAKIEFRPAFFSLPRIIVMLTAIVVDIILGVFVLPRALNLYQQYPNDPTALQVLLVTSGVMILVLLLLLFIIVVSVISKKIWIDNDLLYFANKSFLGKWNNNLINLQEITNIDWREQRGYKFIRYWFIFTSKDNHKQEIHLTGWDYPTLKTILLYVKGKYSNIKINTPVHRDSSEELSGINEFVGKNEPKQ